jgi:RNA-directed DNA polymerase
VLDADIAACFDTIAPAPLLSKLQTYPARRRTIRGWLKAGVLEGDVFAPTEAGTPQGGGLSPWLANVALHGMEQALQEGYAPGKDTPKPKLVRSADDLVVLFPTREGVERARGVLQGWLAQLGLELKPSKTRICHTLEPLEEQPPGFDFVGCTVRQYPVGKYHGGRTRNGQPRGFKTLITPSREAVTRHVEQLRQTVRRKRGASQEDLIGDLNPLIGGWANYYKPQVAKVCFGKLDAFLFGMLWKWAKWRHPKKGRKWRRRKYWQRIKTRQWVFAPPEGQPLLRHAQVKIKRQVKVAGTVSPYDGNLVYWAKRT